MNRKAQAAMEFLMTYGWAILVVLAAIGALAYFGVLSPSKFLPSSCNTGITGISCEDFIVSSSAGISVEIRNGLGRSVTLNDIKLTDSTGTDATAPVDNTVIADGGTTTLTWPATSFTGSVGDKFKDNIYILYTPDGGLQHTANGELTTKIEE